MILALIEHNLGEVSKLSYEGLTFGRALAEKTGASLSAVLIGHDLDGMIASLANYGIETLYTVSDSRLDDYAPDAWAAATAQIIGSESPKAVISVGSDRGSEVMARVAARLDLPMAANVQTVEADGDSYSMTRVRWGGSLLEDATLSAPVKLMTIAQHFVEASENGSGAPTASPVSVEFSDADFRVKVSGRIVPDKEGVSLTDAPVVVSGGRGVGSAEGFEALNELAHLVGGAVGCSRAVTNHGWQPHANQVGQTGARVAPDLYIAAGISGASQHMAGCAGSKKLLVINTDPDAPILSKADYGVIGDLHELIPAISEEIRRRKG